MENSQDIEVELYEEIVGESQQWYNGYKSSTADVRELPPSQEPMPYSGNAETSLATTPRSALRPQLAGYPKEPRTVAVTITLSLICLSVLSALFYQRADTERAHSKLCHT